MKSKLLSMFPEFDEFRNLDIKEKTLLVWEEAMKKGGWSSEDLLQMPFTLLIDKTNVNIIEHTRAVAGCAMATAEVLEKIYGQKISINKDYLLAGALLHDIGKLFEYEKKEGRFQKSLSGKMLRHPISGAVFAARYGLPEDILHIIAAHSKEGDGRRSTVEAIIVNHADFVNFEPFKI